jgi:hypothetical protein
MSERKRYADKEVMVRKYSVVGRVKMWPWSSAPARRSVKVLNVKVSNCLSVSQEQKDAESGELSYKDQAGV